MSICIYVCISLVIFSKVVPLNPFYWEMLTLLLKVQMDYDNVVGSLDSII